MRRIDHPAQKRHAEGVTNARAAIFFIASEMGGRLRLGGAEKRMLRTLNDVARGGAEVDVVLMTSLDPAFVREEISRVLEPEGLRLGILLRPSQLSVFLQVVRARYSVILYTDSYRAMLPFLAGGIFIRSRRLMLHVTTFLAPGRYQSIKQWALFTVVRRFSTHIDVLYPEAYERVRRWHPRKGVTLTPLPSTRVDLFKPESPEKRIVFLGAVAEVKGIRQLMESMAEVAAAFRIRGYTLDVCGVGPLLEQVAQFVDDHGISDVVKLRGQQDPLDVLPSAEAFVSLQAYNNYPSQSLLEAISAGCFIIATDEGDTRMIVRPEFGRLVPRESDAIATALEHYVQLPEEEKARARSASRQFALSELRNDRSSDHYSELIGAVSQ